MKVVLSVWNQISIHFLYDFHEIFSIRLTFLFRKYWKNPSPLSSYLNSRLKIKTSCNGWGIIEIKIAAFCVIQSRPTSGFLHWFNSCNCSGPKINIKCSFHNRSDSNSIHRFQIIYLFPSYWLRFEKEDLWCNINMRYEWISLFLVFC